jgi:GNAT superfamily N-acetyltransferase
MATDPPDATPGHSAEATAYTVEPTDNPAAALSTASSFLATRPGEHNLQLDLLHQRIHIPTPGRYWTVRESGRVCGFALRSPPTYALTLTPMPRPGTHALAGTIADTEPELTGVIGEAATASAFAGYYADRRPARVIPKFAQRFYRLGGLRPPAPVAGRLRTATIADHPLITSWFTAYLRDIDVSDSGVPPALAMERSIAAGRMHVWDNGGPVSMAAATSASAGVSRIVAVYTPDALRGRGYAAACVGALCAALVGQGLGCVLFTELHNPTSNGIYRRLGFEPVNEVIAYDFVR